MILTKVMNVLGLPRATELHPRPFLSVIDYTIAMRYYEVLVGDSQFHGDNALTYSWDGSLVSGAVVRISLRSRSALGLLVREVPKPSFTTKPIAAVADSSPIPQQALSLLLWLKEYYPAPLGVIVRQFLPPTTAFPKPTKQPTEQTLKKPSRTTLALPPLTSDQKRALKTTQAPGSYLLHGITGSGKTRLYVELARRVLTEGKSVIILTPEIGLTEHLVQAFGALPEQTYVLHSRLTAAARRDIWYELLDSTKPVVVIGPRSALFTPLKNIGLIVMDESHDQAYKSDSAPHYRSDRVAAKLSQLHNAQFVSGSATPSVEDYYVAIAKGRPVVPLTSLATQSDHAAGTSTTVDLRDSSVYGRSRIISQPLLVALREALGRGEQSLLFLNRRGTASAILCSTCGWRALCPHCDLPLTYHGDAHTLRCHICGRGQPLPPSCPGCGQTEIVFKTIGTKAVVEEVERLFPTARLRRFDTDTTKLDQIEHQLEALHSGEVDIIIGTQMITKGLDLPKLSVVGILNADSGLVIPDYTANERTYQLIHQVIGRVGRGHRRGHVFLQTYNPDHPTIRAALAHNWSEFYEHELAERRAYAFPPFCYLVKLSNLRATSASAEKSAVALCKRLQELYPKIIIEGPAPAFHPRESGKYRWQLVVKSPSRTALLQIISLLPSGWTHDIDPVNLL